MRSILTARVVWSVLGLTLVVIAACESGLDVGRSPDELMVRTLDLDRPFGERSFHRVVDVLPTTEGAWVLSLEENALTFLPLDGRLPTTFARRGGGPGEVRLPVALTAAPAADPDAPGIEVWDFGSRRVTHFTNTGVVDHSTELNSSFSTRIRADLPDVTFAKPFKVRRQGTAVVAAHFDGPVTLPHHLRQATLVRGEEDLGPASGSRGIRAMGNGELVTPPLGHTPVPLWDVCDASTMVLLDPDTRSLTWVVDGEVGSTAPLPFPTRDLTQDERMSYVMEMARLEAGEEALADPEMMADLENMADASSGLFPKTAPPASGLICLSDRSALVREFDASTDPLGHS